MKNTMSLGVKLAAGVMALAAVAAGSVPAEAREGRNAAAAAGAIAGIAAGAAIASGAARPAYPAYQQAPRRAYAPVRERRVIVERDDDEECFVRTRRVYVDGVVRVRRQTVCQ
jgi:hypothetical protein